MSSSPNIINTNINNTPNLVHHPSSSSSSPIVSPFSSTGPIHDNNNNDNNNDNNNNNGDEDTHSQVSDYSPSTASPSTGNSPFGTSPTTKVSHQRGRRKWKNKYHNSPHHQLYVNTNLTTRTTLMTTMEEEEERVTSPTSPPLSALKRIKARANNTPEESNGGSASSNTVSRDQLKLNLSSLKRENSFQSRNSSRGGDRSPRTPITPSALFTPRGLMTVLQSPRKLPGFGIDDVEEDLPVLQALKKFLFPELWFLFKSCYAIIITNICISSQESIEFAFAGQLGETELAAAALAQAYYNCCSYILIGLVSGQTTLVSQAEGLSNSGHMRRTVLKRSFLLITLFSIPLLVLLNVGGYVLKMLQEEPVVVTSAGLYLNYYSISLLATGYNAILTEYMVAQSYFVLPMLCAIFGVVIDVLANLTLTRGMHRKKTKIGFIGAAISAAITRWISFLLLIGCVLFIELYKSRQERKQELEQEQVSSISVDSQTPAATQGETARKALEEEENLTFKQKISRSFQRNVIDVIDPRGIWEYMKVGVPGSMMLVAETWNLEIATIIAGFLQNPVYLSAHSVVVSVCVWVFTVPFSIGTATSVRVGYCIGSNKPNKAKVSAFIGIAVALIFMIFALIMSSCLRWYLPKIFTSSKEVLEISAILLPIASAIQILDGLQTTIGAIIQGMGNQYVGASSNILGYYCIGFPVGVILAFTTPLHIYGLWIGIGVGLVFVVIVISGYVMVFAGFRREVPRAKRRVTRSDVRLGAKRLDVATPTPKAATPNTQLSQDPTTTTSVFSPFP